MNILILLSLLSFFPSEGDKIEVKDAWLRTGAAGLNTALYFTIENNSDKADTLYKVTSDAAKVIQIHESYKKDNMMGMRHVDNIIIEPNSRVKFKPGGYHIMLIKLNRDLKENDVEKFILHFGKNGDIEITARVKNK